MFSKQTWNGILHHSVNPFNLLISSSTAHFAVVLRFLHPGLIVPSEKNAKLYCGTTQSLAVLFGGCYSCFFY